MARQRLQEQRVAVASSCCNSSSGSCKCYACNMIIWWSVFVFAAVGVWSVVEGGTSAMTLHATDDEAASPRQPECCGCFAHCW
jgi:hypothetical protein